MKRHARALLTLLTAAALLTWIAVAQMPDGRLHVIFLDVEGGQGILLRAPSGRYAVIDGGSRSSVLMAALGRHLPFWQRTLHATVATHQGNGALLPLIDAGQRYRVITALGPPLGSSPSAAYKRWRTVLDERRTPLVEARTGTVLDLGDNVHLEVVAAGSRLALSLSHGEISLLLPGTEAVDLSGRAAQVVAFPANSRSQVRPPLTPDTTTVILLNGPKQPASPASAAPDQAQIYSTAVSGSIEMISDGQHYEIRPVK